MDHIHRPALRRSLFDAAFDGYFWIFTGSVAQAVIRIVVLAILARLLTPVDFGLVGAAMLVVSLADVLGQSTIIAALVQKPELRQRDLETASGISLLMGVVLSAAVAVGAPFAGRLFNAPDLPLVLQIIGLTFLIQGFGAVPQAVLQREMRFRTIAHAKLASFTVGYAVVSVVTAWLGFGVWALVFGQLAQALLGNVLFFVLAPHRTRIRFERAAAKHLLNFATGFSLSRIGSYIALNGDYFIVGRFIGLEALGIYTRAYYFMQQPVNLIGALTDQVLFPVLAAVQQDSSRLVRAYSQVASAIFVMTLPLAVFLTAFASDFVALILGGAWAGVVAPFQILALAMPFRVAYKLNNTMLGASGAVYRGALANWVYGLVLVAAAAGGALNGVVDPLTGVALAVAFVIAANLLIGFCFVRTMYPVALWPQLLTLVRYTVLSAVLVAPAILVRDHTVVGDMPSFVRLAVGGLVYGAGFAILLLFVPVLLGPEGAMVRDRLWTRARAVLQRRRKE